MEIEKDPVIQRFREYLMIPSVHPDVDYSGCVAFLKKQASLLALPVVVHEFAAKKPVVIITWTGTQPELPAILLNSHMDVVPVYEEHWTYPPFSATITKDGWIYARGTQDMKSIGMMHLEAVRNLKNAGVQLKRTVHVSFVPDEEIGSAEGMKLFSESKEFDRLNIGFELDESMPNSEPGGYILFYGERNTRQILITCKGVPCHGSLLGSGTAGEKIVSSDETLRIIMIELHVQLYYVIDKFMKLREAEKRKLDSGADLGDVTTVNLTQLQGGVQVNVLPEVLSVSFDIRIAPQVDLDVFENMINTWCAEAGSGVTWEYYFKNPAIANTRINDSNPYFGALVQAVAKLGKTIKSKICPGATDARFVRARGIHAINFSPLAATPLLLHAHDERLHVHEYRNGIQAMTGVVEAVANV